MVTWRGLERLLSGGAFGLFVVEGGVGVGEVDVAGAEDFEAVVEVCAGGEALGAEAGAGVVDFEEIDGLGGVVADGGGDVRRAAAGECEQARRRWCGGDA